MGKIAACPFGLEQQNVAGLVRRVVLRGRIPALRLGRFVGFLERVGKLLANALSFGGRRALCRAVR
jgi:hypothetical protein